MLIFKVFPTPSMLWTIKDDKVCYHNICKMGTFSSSAAFSFFWASSSVVRNEVLGRRKRREKLSPADLIRNKFFSRRLMNSRRTRKKYCDGDMLKKLSGKPSKALNKLEGFYCMPRKWFRYVHNTKPSSINCQCSTCQQLVLKSQPWNRLKSFSFAGNLKKKETAQRASTPQATET